MHNDKQPASPVVIVDKQSNSQTSHLHFSCLRMSPCPIAQVMVVSWLLQMLTKNVIVVFWRPLALRWFLSELYQTSRIHIAAFGDYDRYTKLYVLPSKCLRCTQEKERYLSVLRKTTTLLVRCTHRLPGEHKVFRFTPRDFRSSESLQELREAPGTL